ncbi:MAG: GTPase domain-containing protein [Candidatus Hodarchaeales archaeon]|jgi:GTPase SAR1 family protein
MTLLAVKVYDDENQEIVSTISVTPDDYTLPISLPAIRRLLVQNNNDKFVQGWVCGNNFLAFSYLKPQKVLLVAIASINTAFSKLKAFLKLLGKSYKSELFEEHHSSFQKDFQDICDTVVRMVDSSTTLSVSLLGLARSGKTTFIQQYITEQQLAGFNSYEPTKLVNIVTQESSSKSPHLRFYDLGMAFQQHWWKFSSESDGYIFFVDISDIRSINASKELLEEIRNFWDLPYVIAANKIDVGSIKNVRRYLSRKLMAPIRLIYETESSTGTGFKPLIERLLSEIQKNKSYSSIIEPQPSENEFSRPT